MKPAIDIRPASHPRYQFVAVWHERGVRKKKYFKTKNAANEWRSKHAATLAHITPAEGPATPEEYRAVIHARHHRVPLWDAVEHWRNTVGKSQGATIADLCQRRLEEAVLEDYSARHAATLANILPRIVAAIGDLPAATVTVEQLSTYVRARGKPSTQRYYRAILSQVFNSAMRAGLVSSNPASLVRTTRAIGAKPPEIFTPEEGAEWLACVALEAPGLLAGTAVGMFAGLRVAEVSRLDWREIRLSRGFIEVTAAKSKTRTRRLVDIMPNLGEWLRPLANDEGPVWPHTPDRPRDRAIRAFGKKLPANGARHSFVSYHLALFGDVAKTELQAGHDREILFGHYRELVTQDQAEEWFTLVPGS